ncbi:methyltransferase family protein [Baia soyae]|uniref:Methyltransferase family protein n=1 Tax=Baia soyae TaxID=1544746 RepID=A0A4R2S5H9_9BACL|nr:methyltransferase family protein [Baia soyae]
MTIKQQYDDISQLYDQFIPEPAGMIEFYLDIPKEKSKILDLGCGSGRLAFALAEQGHEVHAFDISPGMIGRAQKKLDERTDLTGKLTFGVSDIRELQIQDEFDFIFITGGVFEYLLTIKEQRKVLDKVKSLLKPNGKFVMDIISPPQICPYSSRQGDGGGKTPNATEELVHSWNEVKFDHYRQVVFTSSFFEAYDQAGKLQDKYNFRFLSRYIMPSEMYHLLENCGYRVNDFYGNYNRAIFRNGSEFMIVVASHSDSKET